jgi:diguanylate cyclase (GGDEF)-like protein
LTVAALGVHLAGGRIEAHFSFFVLVMLLTIYEDWTVFALAVGYVLAHHGVMGMIDPKEVFHEEDQFTAPWLWAGIHAIFVALAGVAGIIAWRLNENVRRRMLDAQDALAIVADTDALTGLGNRRRLLTDLDDAIGEQGSELTLFDLDGFKAYNDAFGHHAGDVLLERLGGRLAAAVGTNGSAYRLGGDEFCILLAGDRCPELHARAVAALREQGEAFAIASSYGTVALGECASAEEALQLADERMYRHKNGGRASAGQQSKDVLLRALAERYPDLDDHLNGVAEAALQVARALDVPEDQHEGIRQAAELHDIGKVAIPETILHKPAPLDEDEWAFMRQHTIIGERILSAAPGLVSCGRLVRSSHERWDGGGYPDGLRGEEIPLGARIIAVCDAFDAMVTERPYSAAREYQDALAELRRCAGTQFDPVVVAAFDAAMVKTEALI